MIVSLSRSPFAKACALAVVLACVEGCGSSLAQPFDKMEKAPMTAFRLQNFEPPPQPAGAAAPTGLQLPPQIQQWVSAGVSLLPPGLLPPGILPGGAGAVPPQENVPRFHNFRILGSMQINNSSVHEEVLKIFGQDKEFENPRESCMYAEFGFSIAQINQPPADILVSLSCNQVQTFGFAWPHGSKTGLTPDASKRIVDVMKRTFGG